MNPLHAIDFYKADHMNQYPKGTEYVYSNGTPRSNRLSNTGADKLVFFGLQKVLLQFFLKDFNEHFFNKPKEEIVRKYIRRMNNALGQGAIGSEHIEALHDLGYLPLEVRALPEGSQVPMGVPVFTIVNTLPEFFWLTNYLESVLSNQIWKASTSATTAFEYKKLLTKFARITGAPEELIQFQAHDFSFRGMSGLEDALMSGMAHLTCFTGTDTVLAIDGIEDFYHGDSDKELIGCSVPATEHSVMCMGGKEAEVGSEIPLAEAVSIHLEKEFPNLAQRALNVEPDMTGSISSKVTDGSGNHVWAKISATDGIVHTIEYHSVREGGIVWFKGQMDKVITSVTTGELNTFSRLLDTYPVGIVSIVSDTWDFWKVLTEYAKTLKDKILARKGIYDPEGNMIMPGKTVFRPDSGDPVHILTGYLCYDANVPHEHTGADSYIKTPHTVANVASHLGYEAFKFKDKYYKIEVSDLGIGYSDISEAEVKGAVQVLWDEFGGTTTEKGYKLLNEHVGLIYGDSITLDRAKRILERLEKLGFASTNVVLGIGSYTYEYVTRDTYGFAMKATWGQVNGEGREIFKDPITDNGTKKSAKGLLRVIKENGEFKLLDQQDGVGNSELKVVFRNGRMIKQHTISEIRDRLKV